MDDPEVHAVSIAQLVSRLQAAAGVGDDAQRDPGLDVTPASPDGPL